MANFKGLTCIYFTYQLILSLQVQTLVLSQLQPLMYTGSIEDTTCPPGMTQGNMNGNNTALSCQCGNIPSAIDDQQSGHLYNLYDGISYCRQTREGPRAYIKNSYWAGYYGNATENMDDCHAADDLIVTLCPESFCDLGSPRSSPHARANTAKEIYPNFNADEVFCASTHRTGFLCSRCAEGFGDAINTLGSICADCSGGPLAGVTVFIWLLTEIVPEVLLVIVFVTVDIPLLAGHMNAFLLYAHTFKAMNLYANRVLDPTFSLDTARSLSYWIDWIYSLWSLNFIGSAPFFPPLCVSGDFTLLNKLSIQYVVAFLPFPILLLVYVLRLWYRREPSKVCWGCIFRVMQKVHSFIARIQHACGKSSSSVRNGFASFLLLVYSKICFVSFYILATEPLSESCVVVFLDPSLKPFQGQHLVPALVACFSIALFVICPILVLTFYKPLGVRYRKHCAITSALAESPPKVKYRRQIEMFVKILDTFTEGFQSRFAFFGGVLFLYRAVLWIIFANALTPQTQYIVQIAITAALLVVHLICMPYKHKVSWLNRFDAIMYTNIILINGMSLYNISLISSNEDESVAVFVLQQICIIMPMLYPIVALVVLLAKLCIKKKNVASNSISVGGKDRIIYGSTRDNSVSIAESQHYLQKDLEESDVLLSESPLRFQRSELLSFSDSNTDSASERMCSCCQVSMSLCCFSQKRIKYECKSCLDGEQSAQRNLADSHPRGITEVEIIANSALYSGNK